MIKIGDRNFFDVYEVKTEILGEVQSFDLPANSAGHAYELARYHHDWVGVPKRVLSVKGKFFDWPGKEQAVSCLKEIN